MSASFKTTYEQLLSLANLQLTQYTDSKAELLRSLKRTEAFLEQLGDPHKHLDFIHIAGTSGKGSVANMIHHILVTDGQRVGTYTSPHTTSFLERFKYQKGLIDPGVLTLHMRHIIKEYEKFMVTGGILSFFELSTCLAIYCMKKAGVDVCILEAGCGGRWDATNVIPQPVVGVITNIDKDHTDILGDSLALIANEKAGIMKKGSVIFCGETRPSLRKIFTKEAIKKQSALFFVPQPSKKKVREELGKHQQHNAALAERATLELGVSQETIKRAFQTLRGMPCRFETIQKRPTIILDGAHSPAKIAATNAHIKTLGAPVRVIFGCAANKDVQEMVKRLAPSVQSITMTRFQMPFRKAANPAELLQLAPKSKRAGYFLNHSDALKYVKSIAQKDDIILITGSLFLAGEMRANWISEKEILKNRSSFRG